MIRMPNNKKQINMKIIVNILGNHAISIALWALVSVGITTIMRENASIQSKNVSTFETRQYSDLEQEYVKDEIAMIRLPSAIRLQSYNVLLTCYANGRDSQSIEFDELLSQHSGHLEFSSNGHILEMHVKSNLDNSYD